MATRDPFLTPGKTYGASSAADRISKVATFDAGQCLAALDVPGLQQTVETAIRRRLRALGWQTHVRTAAPPA